MEKNGSMLEQSYNICHLSLYFAVQFKGILEFQYLRVNINTVYVILIEI